jgi:hypothetical protein
MHPRGVFVIGQETSSFLTKEEGILLDNKKDGAAVSA